MPTVEGTLFDVHAVSSPPGGVAVWVLDDAGRARRFVDPWRPTIRILAPDPPPGGNRALDRFIGSVRRVDPGGAGRRETRIEFFADREVEVTAWTFGDASAARAIERTLPAWEAEGLRFFDCEIDHATRYLYERDLYPTGRVEVEAGADGVVRAIAARSRAYDEAPLPPLRIAHLGVEDGSLVLEAAGCAETVTLEADDPREAIDRLNDLVRRLDPDVIVTEGGDEALFPALARLAGTSGVPLLLDRAWPRGSDRPGVRPVGRPGSYWSYNRVVRHHARWLLRGRWHLDRAHTFYLGAAGLEGLLEIARIGQVPVQRMSRTSPGTAVSSMQLAEAMRSRILIPREKGEPEGERTAWDLLAADKGGLTYVPPVGAFENVAELDFASMYPTIMARRNVSPERVNCACCPDAPLVPETPHRICRRKEGLVGRVIGPLVEHREALKRRRDAARAAGDEAAAEALDRRQTALKWCGVTCFGYLGYRNARFGRIEAHECVTALGREALLRAKETAEARGYRLLHALTDSLWVARDRLTEADARGLAAEIAAATGLPITLEGIYRWIVFCPSRTRPNLAVPARYFGAFADGRTKERGLMARRHDTPAFVAEAQRSALAALRAAGGLEDLRGRLPAARAVIDEALARLRRGDVPTEALLIEARLSQDPHDYRGRSRPGIAARALARAGRALHAGEHVRYLVTDAASPNEDLRVRPAELAGDETADVSAYAALLERAWAEIAEPIAGPSGEAHSSARSRRRPRPARPVRRTPARRSTGRSAATYPVSAGHGQLVVVGPVRSVEHGEDVGSPVMVRCNGSVGRKTRR